MPRIVHVESDPERARYVADLLAEGSLELRHAATASGLVAALADGRPDAILLGGLPVAEADAIFELAERAEAPVLLIGSGASGFEGHGLAADTVLPSELWRLAPALRRVLRGEGHTTDTAGADRYARGLEQLGLTATRLARARTQRAIALEITGAAAAIAGAVGVRIARRVGDAVVALDDVTPSTPPAAGLMSLAGDALDTFAPIVVEDVASDPRLRAEVTTAGTGAIAFVPVLVDVPSVVLVVTWPMPHRPEPRELGLLQGLANLTALALENFDLVAGLERTVAARTEALVRVNAELEAFNHAVAHDLRAPALNVVGFADALAEGGDPLGPEAAKHVARIARGARLLVDRVDALLELTRALPPETTRGACDVTAIVRELAGAIVESAAPRRVEVEVADGLEARADVRLVRAVFDNLLRNAVKFTATREVAHIEVGFDAERAAFFVRDDGIGFDPARAEEMFRPFRRVHYGSDYPGDGIGLATVRRAVGRLGGRVWAEGTPDHGATIWLSLDGG
jgi:signal transduction histidine kinase